MTATAAGSSAGATTSTANWATARRPDRPTPVDVSGLTSGVPSQWPPAADHTCALTTQRRGQVLGLQLLRPTGGRHDDRPATPVDVSGLTSGVRRSAAGDDHTCALTTAAGSSAGAATATANWGTARRPTSHAGGRERADQRGRRGGGRPFAHLCADDGGGVKCWGYNYYGQLGTARRPNQHTPVDVSGLTSGVAAVAAGGYHTCALTTGGGVKCWGGNNYGQLGDGTTTALHAGGRERAGERRRRRGAGGYHTCALTAGGGVKCWGYNDSANWATARRPTHHAGGRERADQRGRRAGCGRVSHLCADDAARRRGQVLGAERLRPTGRRHDDAAGSRRWT